MSPLAAAFEKVRWANQHLDEFQAKKREFVDSQAYRVRTEFHGEEREWIGMFPEGFRDFAEGIEPQYIRRQSDRIAVSLLTAEIVDLYLKIDGEIPHTEWGVMVGNVVHNLRSALDVLVWELSIKYQTAVGGAGEPLPTEPLPLASPWRQVQFPIVTDGTRWPGELRRLRLIDPALVTEFEELQPWKSGEKTGRPPDQEWPAVLQELWNRDKHRGVSFIATHAAIRDLAIFDSETHAPNSAFETDEIWAQTFGPAEDGTHLARYRIRPQIAIFGQFKVAVRSHVSFDIAFGKGSPAEGLQVSRVLERMSESVTAILLKFLPQLA